MTVLTWLFFLFTDIANNKKKTYKERRGFKGDKDYKETAAKSQKVTANILATHNDERRFGEFNTYRIHWMQEMQGKNAARNLTDKF